ncbi:LysR family transcriptional regulator [Sulfitobacter aestuarii]|uniref:LysR family transcriptional regulator n=1 Tax=Sulfitobacter aestuarii TaxID=2161676 RepID=A0ABW5UA17_9RHOB
MPALPELSLLHSFVTVAQELNFRRSAERLAIDQSALSRRIQKLEANLGYQLFERTTREVLLTPAGQLYFRRATSILADCARSITEARSVAEGRTGRVRIGYMAFAATELMPQAVMRFGAKHPDVALELQYMRTQGQKLALANDEIDVGFMIGPYENSDCHSLLLATERLYVVMPRGHPLLRKHQLDPGDIASSDLILGDMTEWGEYRYRLDDLFNQVGIALQPKLEASNTLALIGLVSAGLGVTVYPESLIGFLGRNVEVRPIFEETFRSRTVLVWKRTNRSRALLQFVDVAKRRGVSR